MIIIITPFFRGPISRKKNFFFFNKIHSQSGSKTSLECINWNPRFCRLPFFWFGFLLLVGGIPYYVPNRSMVIAVAELFSSVLYLISAVGNYRVKHFLSFPTFDFESSSSQFSLLISIFTLRYISFIQKVNHFLVLLVIFAFGKSRKLLRVSMLNLYLSWMIFALLGMV